MGKVNYTLKTLSQQSRKPDIIYLSIPDEVKRLNMSINEKEFLFEGKPLERVIKDLEVLVGPSLKVLRTVDYGPATKLLGALEQEKNPSTIIITVDDDTDYHRDMVLLLVDAIVKNPGTAPCFICEMWGLWGVWLFNNAVRQWWEGVCVGWGNAYKGIAYRVGYFDQKVFDVEGEGVPEGCKLHDDVWISGNMYRKGYRPYVLVPGFDAILLHRGAGNMSIGKVPNSERAYRDPCINYFGNFI
ncbi:hypothetical protein HDU76_008221, partial [Blyttiomyces sp. JEL0837]